MTEPVTGRCLPIPFVTECNKEPSISQPETMSGVRVGFKPFVSRCPPLSPEIISAGGSNSEQGIITGDGSVPT